MLRLRTLAALLVLITIGGFAGAGGASVRSSPARSSVDELRFFANSGRSVICRYSSFSGVQLLKCTDRRVKGEDGGPFTVQLKKTGKPGQLLLDSRPIEKIGGPVARFSRPGFTCTLTASAVRCTNSVRHGFLLKLPQASLF